jgi:2,3-diketo-5-methylthio-1-phosphopentane phosphatase
MSEARPKLYLLDVEGTVAPLTLTTEVLFPYARAHFETFLWQSVEEIGNRVREMRDRGESGEADQIFAEDGVWRDVMMLTIENSHEHDPGAPRILPEVEVNENPGPGGERSCVSMSPGYAIPHVLEYVFWLMDHDRKSTALKSLQGKIWKRGFESGELKGTLFDDVPEALRRWSAGARVAIYSSGSVEAQKLLFRYSNFGDLTPLIAGYFDTRTGPKMESASYAAIAAAMKVAPAELLFFSDAVRELDAAREAGCGTRLVVREGNAPVEGGHGHAMITSLD